MVFGIIPECCSASARNRVRLQPGIVFGLPRNTQWMVIRVEDRTEYLAALDRASIDLDIVPFAEFIADRVR